MFNASYTLCIIAPWSLSSSSFGDLIRFKIEAFMISNEVLGRGYEIKKSPICYTYQHVKRDFLISFGLNIVHHFTLLLVLIDVEKLHTSDALFSTNWRQSLIGRSFPISSLLTRFIASLMMTFNAFAKCWTASYGKTFW